MKLIRRLRSKKLSNSKLQNDGVSCKCNVINVGQGLGGGSHSHSHSRSQSLGDVDDMIKWELRPGGMLVQKRDHDINATGSSDCERRSRTTTTTITVRVSTVVSKSHHISISPTSTFGEMKVVLSMVTNMEREEQRLVFKGKEREDSEYLYMVGVKDQDKVFLLQDPAIRQQKLLTDSTAAAGNV